MWARMRSRGIQRQITQDRFALKFLRIRQDAAHRTISDDNLPARTRRQVPQAPAAERKLSGLVGIRHCGVGRLTSHRALEGRAPRGCSSASPKLRLGLHDRVRA